tara:strand:+ start:2321 stop:2572 length:252 start_codon:yes stop_codon:yes gene_type:complete
LKDIDPDNLKDFQIPESFLSELFELTGDSESSRGFILGCVGQDGRPFIYAKASSPVIDLGLRKSMEEYLVETEDSDSMDFLSD